MGARGELPVDARVACPSIVALFVCLAASFGELMISQLHACQLSVVTNTNHSGGRRGRGAGRMRPCLSSCSLPCLRFQPAIVCHGRRSQLGLQDEPRPTALRFAGCSGSLYLIHRIRHSTCFVLLLCRRICTHSIAWMKDGQISTTQGKGSPHQS